MHRIIGSTTATAETRRRALLGSRLMRAVRGSDAGMTTAEYAVGTVAACGFGAVLYKILTSSFASGLLEGLISRALHVTL